MGRRQEAQARLQEVTIKQCELWSLCRTGTVAKQHRELPRRGSPDRSHVRGQELRQAVPLVEEEQALQAAHNGAGACARMRGWFHQASTRVCTSHEPAARSCELGPSAVQLHAVCGSKTDC